MSSEKTTKVAVTLLPHQVEAMKQLGNGNVSAGIRKAIEILEYIDHIAPPADSTCAEPGITLSEAVRRTLFVVITDCTRCNGSGFVATKHGIKKCPNNCEFGQIKKNINGVSKR